MLLQSAVARQHGRNHGGRNTLLLQLHKIIRARAVLTRLRVHCLQNDRIAKVGLAHLDDRGVIQHLAL